MTLVRRNTIASIAGRVVTALLWLAITPYVLSRLGSERFGIWALFFAFNGYLTSFDLGIGSTMIRFVATGSASGNRRSLRRTLARGLGLSLGLGVFWALLVLVMRPWIAHAFHVPAGITAETLGALRIFALGVLLLLPAQALTASLQGFERLDLSNLCMVLGVAAQMPILYFGIAGGGGLTCVAAAGVVGQAVTGLAAATFLWFELRGIRSDGGAPGPAWHDMLGFGAALQLTGVLIILQLQAGKILLGLLGNLSMVADYELAFRVASGIASLPALVLSAVAPAAARLWESDGAEGVAGLFTATLRWIYIYSVIVLGMLWLVAPDITHVWLGPGHDHIAPLIRMWAIAYALNLAWSPAATVARAIGQPWIEALSLAAAVATNIGLGLWLVPRFGTMGATAIVGIAYGAGFLTFVAASRRARFPFGPWIRRELLPRVLAGSLGVALCAMLLIMKPVSGYLPPPGIVHGMIAGLLFLTTFAVLFLPLGDTGRLLRTLRQLIAGSRARDGSLSTS